MPRLAPWKSFRRKRHYYFQPRKNCYCRCRNYSLYFPHCFHSLLCFHRKHSRHLLSAVPAFLPLLCVLPPRQLPEPGALLPPPEWPQVLHSGPVPQLHRTAPAVLPHPDYLRLTQVRFLFVKAWTQLPPDPAQPLLS